MILIAGFDIFNSNVSDLLRAKVAVLIWGISKHLNELISPTGLFGLALEDMQARFEAKKKQEEALHVFLPWRFIRDAGGGTFRKAGRRSSFS